jgi:hypothetical protein
MTNRVLHFCRNTGLPALWHYDVTIRRYVQTQYERDIPTLPYIPNSTHKHCVKILGAVRAKENIIILCTTAAAFYRKTMVIARATAGKYTYVSRLRRAFLLQVHPDRFRNQKEIVRKQQASLVQGSCTIKPYSSVGCCRWLYMDCIKSWRELQTKLVYFVLHAFQSFVR